MEDFVGRRRELGVLERAYGRPESAFLPIYGRRRVGKSELILEFMRDRPGIYFLGKKAPAGLQIREFLAEASAALGQPLLAEVSATGWTEALDLVLESAERSHLKGAKLVLALDEFQWTVEASPELPSILQAGWDRKWKRSGRLLLILCGSYVGFMEREVLGRKSPLFGRRTEQILLRPFGYREAAEFHPGYSTVDRAKTYFLCGGIPLYLRYFSDRVSVEANVAERILDEHAALYREPDFLLREELREVENYHGVLLAVALGDAEPRSMATRIGIPERSLHYYLHNLVELGYLRRGYPLRDGRRIKRHVRYEVDDPLLRFWFRFVFPRTSQLLRGGARQVLREHIRPALEGYFGLCFERLCREALPELYAREGVGAAFEIGQYWDKHTQIDVVGLRDDGWVDLGECKWGSVRSTRKVQDELEERVARYPNPENRTVGRRIFCRRRPPARQRVPEGTRWHSLEELYEPAD